MRHSLFLLLLLALKMISSSVPASALPASKAETDRHTNNWAVIVSTSRYWFNYRHASDALSFYHIVRRLGIPDSNIILMLPDDMACNPRNPVPGQVFNNKDRAINLYGEKAEVDYRGYEVTVENILRVLTGRHAPAVPRSKRLLSDAGSNVLVYISGHGGDDFMKFQDQEEIMGKDIADAIAQMHEKRRYRQLLLFVETCEAETLTEKVYSPNVLTIATSKLGEKSYSHHSDMGLGLTVIDRVTYYALQWFREHAPNITSIATLQHFLDYVSNQELDSSLVWSHKLFPRTPAEIPITDFFGSVPFVAVDSDATVNLRTTTDARQRQQQQQSAIDADDSDAGIKSGTPSSRAAAASEGASAAAEATEVGASRIAATAAAAPAEAATDAASCPNVFESQAEAATSSIDCSSELQGSASDGICTAAGDAQAGWQAAQGGSADVPLLLAVAAVAAAAVAVSKRRNSKGN